MVVFACNSCGTSLKKNQVDKHVFQCRCSTVSCMDCQKDFGIKEYGAHIKCVSETEKYGGAGWKAPANFNKGEKKQEAWVDTVNNTLKQGSATLTPACKSLLHAISKHDNVPRKKPKFVNFVKNVARNKFDEQTIENVFNVIDEQWKAQAEANKAASEPASANGKKKDKDAEKENGGTEKADGDKKEIPEVNGDEETSQENGVTKLSKRDKKEARRQKQNKEEKKEKKSKNSVSEGDDGVQEPQQEATNGHKESKKDKKKRKRVESASELEKKKTRSENGDEDEVEEAAGEEGEDAGEEGISPGDFKWGTIIREILEKQPDHEISMKKLKKKVLSEYYAVVGDSKGNKSQEELISKLNKKLRKLQFKVFKDTVKLIE